jgi:hypothetical protein
MTAVDSRLAASRAKLAGFDADQANDNPAGRHA